jgi:hypothetical protein
LDHGFGNYKRISNALRWLKQNSKILDYSKEAKIVNDPYRALKELGYKMAWECLYERMYNFEIIKARKSIIDRSKVKKYMIKLKGHLEKFLKSRIDYILSFNLQDNVILLD